MTVQASAVSMIPDSVARLRVALGRAAPAFDGLDWVARLPSAAAPGFVYLAGACRGVAVGGGGHDLAEAAARLAGETAEVLAQTSPPVPRDDPADPAIDALWTAVPAPLRVAATNVATGRRVGVPAAAIFRSGRAADERAPDAPPTGLGLAAGPDRTTARLAALMELIERDAAAAWWNAGAAPRQVAAGSVAADIARLRAGAARRRGTAFMHLPSATGVPVICALSRDPGGRGLALGLKAAPDPDAAVMGALMELLQMEIALEMARLRAGRGAATRGDRGVLARAELDPDRFDAFAARLPADHEVPVPPGFDALVAHLAGLGLAVTVADLPVPPGTPAVAKVFVPGLRPLPGPGPVHPHSPGAQAVLL
jgi:ribosomal protein S12 methylthiotransferase accessory factor